MAGRLCADCGNELLGRADKKFCNDNCRNNFNNSQNKDANNLVRNVNNILRRNRRIMLDLNPQDKRKVKKAELDNKGFNFNYFTSLYETKNGQIYYFCYEYGYLPLEGDYYLLVHRTD